MIRIRTSRLPMGARLGTLAVLTALLLALIAQPAHAAFGVFERGFRIGGESADRTTSIAVDSAGNLYITGSFRDIMVLGSGTSARLLESNGTSDMYVAKYRPDGSLVWAASAGGSLEEIGSAIAVDRSGNVYVAGTYRNGARFDSRHILSSQDPNGDIFVARYLADGTLSWVAVTRGEKGETLGGLSVDSQGNALIVGNHNGRLFVVNADESDSVRTTPIFPNELFVARYGSQLGRAEWANIGSSPAPATGVAVAADGQDGIYLAGTFRNHLILGGGSPGSNIVTAADEASDIVLARYDLAGRLQWIRTLGGLRHDNPTALAVGAGRLYVAGNLAGQSPGAGVPHVVRLSLAGQNEGSNTVRAEQISALAVDSVGNVHLTGSFTGSGRVGDSTGSIPFEAGASDERELFFAGLNPDLTPRFAVASQSPQPGDSHASLDLAVDNAGRGYVVGEFTEELQLGELNFKLSENLGDGFVARYRVDSAAVAPTPEVIYVSGIVGGTAGGVSFNDEDVLAFEPASRRWSMLIDGSDIGLGAVDLDAFHWLEDNTVLLSLDQPLSLPGLAEPVDDSDVVRFVPTRLGTTTEGRFELFLDGSDVGLDSDGEDVDAIALYDGKLIFSTLSTAIVPGDGGSITATDKDVLLFNGTPGPSSRGVFARVFAGASLGLSSAEEDLSTLWMAGNRQTGERFLIGTQNSFQLSNGLSGQADDIFDCPRGAAEPAPSCKTELFFDGSGAGFPTRLDAFALGLQGVLGEIVPGDESQPTPEPGDEARDDPDPASVVYLPLLRRP